MRYLLIFIALVIKSFLTNAQNGHARFPAIISGGKEVRFTVLTPQLIRMEWDSTGKFNDAPSFVVINRNLPVPSFTTKQENGCLIITTNHLNLRYKLNTGKFNADNLQINYTSGNNPVISWKPGDQQQFNLKGTARTLDTYEGDSSVHSHKKLLLGDGLLSRDGWTLLNDSSLLFDQRGWAWVKTRDHQEQDWYFFGYGNDYKQALYDYTLIAGKVPLPPRFAFGYWWSRYWKYSENELRDLLGHFEEFNLPLDVLVIDMDWHNTDSMFAAPDAFRQPKFWTGYTWDRGLFPDPPAFLSFLKNRHIKTTLNLHPASGIAPFESTYSDFAKRMNFDTTGKANIPYQGSNQKFMRNLFDVVLDPLKKQGVNFWWLDWQQWPKDKAITNLDNVWWLNYVFFSHMQNSSGERPLIYHRWGGLGNHRYQIGFSGDAIISWKSLAYQPYFTTTASNVLYGYWSHDIGGHMFAQNQQHVLDPELYTRWLQFGTFSPIFRTHSSKDAAINKEVWNFKGDYYEALRNAVKLRYTLAPYIYTQARKTYDTGLSLCRPLYYDYPNEQQAYDLSGEYQFGDDLLIAPVTAPATDGLSVQKVWLPSGNDWFEWNTGTLLKGGQTLERSFTLTEYPVYVKAGAIIPMYNDTIKNLQQIPAAMAVGIFPGGNGQTRIYEDNGNDQQYVKEHAWTTVNSVYRADRSQLITISPTTGSYKDMPQVKTWQIKLYGAEMPESILVNNHKLVYQKNWRYDGSNLCVIVTIPNVSKAAKTQVEVYYNKTHQANINDGLVAQFKRLSRATTMLKYKEADLMLPQVIGTAEETNRSLEYHPEKFYELIDAFRKNYRELPETIKEARLEPAIEDWYIRASGCKN